jgi:murein hydrolase activator
MTRRLLRLGAICALGLLCAPDIALSGQARSDRERAADLARRATERIRALQQEADALAAQSRTLLVELRRLELDRQLKAEEVVRLEAEAMGAEADLATTAAAVAELEAEVVAAAPAVGARLAALYKMGRPGYWRLLFGADDLRGAGRAYRTVAAMARLDRERVEDHQRKLAALKDTRAVLERRTRDARRVAAEAGAARATLDRAIATRNARVRAIDRERDLNAQLTGELQDAQRELQAALSRLAASRPGERDATETTLLLPLAPFRGELPWPVPGRVTVPFGRERDARFGTSIARNGVEIAALEGHAVAAVHDGRVAFAGPFTGFGNLVILEHARNSYSLYGHMRAIAVREGEIVERQRQIGTVGTTPTGRAALYFELRVDGRPVDPLQWLQR